MAAASAGRGNLKDGNTAVNSFCSASQSPACRPTREPRSQFCERVKSSSAELIAKSAKERCDERAIARINAMLHCSYDRLDQFYAGNIYHVVNGTSIAELTDWTKFADSFVGGKPGTDEWKANRDKLRRLAHCVAIETNATCDHANNKVKVPRLLGGLLVPREEIEKPDAPRLVPAAPSRLTLEGKIVSLVHGIASWWRSRRDKLLLLSLLRKSTGLYSAATIFGNSAPSTWLPKALKSTASTTFS